jgi:hypothetical protein
MLGRERSGSGCTSAVTVPCVFTGGKTTDYKGDTSLDTVTAHLLTPRSALLPACRFRRHAGEPAQDPARTDIVGDGARVCAQLHKFVQDYKAKPKSETGRQPFDFAAALKKMDAKSLAGMAGPLA